MQRPVIYLYTDGAASGNPGPGGYGVVLKCAGLTREISGGFRTTTNNRMELLAVIVGLEAIKWANAEVEVWSLIRGEGSDRGLAPELGEEGLRQGQEY